MKKDKRVEKVEIINNMFVNKAQATRDALFCRYKAKELDKKGKIYYFESDFTLNCLMHSWYMGKRLSHLYQPVYTINRCFASAIVLSSCFEDCEFVISNLTHRASFAFCEEYDDINKSTCHQYDEARLTNNTTPSFFHGYLVVKGKELGRFIGREVFDFKPNVEYCIDTTDGTIMRKIDYDNFYGADLKLSITKKELSNSPIYKNLLSQMASQGDFNYDTYCEYARNLAEFEAQNGVDMNLQSILINDLYLIGNNLPQFRKMICDYHMEDNPTLYPSYDFLPHLE